MKPRIAIPSPHSSKPEYNAKSLPRYVHAIEASGGEAVTVPLDITPAEIAKLASSCHGVLLPGSPADVDPQKYAAEKAPQTNEPDALRDMADELLLQDAYNIRKPVFGICYGLQSLNVWRTGTLLQDLPHRPVNHEAGKLVTAHAAEIAPASRLASIIHANAAEIEVNSSHHQSADVLGDALRVVARSPKDGVIEALEGTQPEHWVLAVQWHPEKGFDEDAVSQALFREFVIACKV
jgi:putative glutamine amidotransferase